MHDFIINFFSGFPKELATFLISLIPITELRAAIPVAVLKFGMNPAAALFWAVIGTFFAMVIIVLFLDVVSVFLSKHFELFKKFFDWLFYHTKERVSEKMEKYEEWAIFILAATPIPLIGGMTAALAAFLFGISLKKSIPLMFFGTIVSGIIVLGITLYL